ncbi:hypothetical protein D3C78_17600 [compost metagenome]
MMNNFIGISSAMMEEYSKRSKSSKAIKDLIQALQSHTKLLSDAAQKGYNEVLLKSINGNFGMPGLNEKIQNIHKIARKDGEFSAIFVLGAAMEMLDMVLVDTGDDPELRTIIGNLPMTQKEAIAQIEQMSNLSKADQYILLHRVLGFIITSQQKFLNKCKDTTNLELRTLMNISDSIITSEQFNIVGLWQNMTEDIYHGKDVHEQVMSCLKTILALYHAAYNMVSVPEGVREFVVWLNSHDIKFQEKKILIAQTEIDLSDGFQMED